MATPSVPEALAQEQDDGQPLDQGMQVPDEQTGDTTSSGDATPEPTPNPPPAPASTPTPPTVGATPTPAPLTTPRPILHFDLDASAGRQQLVLIAVDANGQRYVEAFQARDLRRFAQILTQDVVLTMPPLPLRYIGREAVAAFYEAVSYVAPGQFTFLRTRANREPALATYRRDADADAFRPVGMWVLRADGSAIAEITAFIDASLGFINHQHARQCAACRGSHADHGHDGELLAGSRRDGLRPGWRTRQDIGVRRECDARLRAADA